MIDLIRDKKGKVISTMLSKELESVSARFESYCRELPVFRFNSVGYDIKLVKQCLFKELCRWDESPSFTVKKARKYPCIKSESLKFLDILQFLAPGYKLKYFFKAFDANEEKGFFSYDYFMHFFLVNWVTPHYHPLKPYTLPLKDVMFLKKIMRHSRNSLTKVKINKKPSRFYVHRKY